MKITLIGGNGFIGSHIVDRLIKEGRHSLTVFGRSPNPFSPLHSEVEYIYGDFEDIDLLRKALWSADVVVHLLSTTVPVSAGMDTVYDIRSNLIGTINLLEEVGKQNIKRFIYASSGGTVYGNPDYTPIDEKHPLKPIGSYGITKVAIESYIQMYAKKYGFSFMIIRPSNPYGPRQSFKGMQGVISTFLFKMLKGEPIVIWGDGSAIRDYIYIDDVADFFVKSINIENSGIYNLGFGKGFNVNDLILILEKGTGITATIKYQDFSDSNVREVVLDMKRVKEIFKWAPKTNLEKGIEEHHKWIKSQLYE